MVLKGLIWQLFKQLPQSTTVEDMVFRRLQRLRHLDTENRMLDGLMSVLTELSGYFDQVYIIVDEVDACPEGLDLLSLLSRSSGSNQSILVASRSSEDFVNVLQGQQSLEISTDSLNDYVGFIDWELEHDREFTHLSPSVKQNIREFLLRIDGKT